MASVLNNGYPEISANYMVVDCRYPYEFEGGHIQVRHGRLFLFENFWKSGAGIEIDPKMDGAKEWDFYLFIISFIFTVLI